jgi:hypothetical protein
VRGALLVCALLGPVSLGAQEVILRERTSGRGAGLIDSVLARPHVVRSGSARLDLPRDSTITTSLVVLGRPTYLASRVQGDVVVIGADLFLRPGVQISGRAVAIGGTVAQTSLGRVDGEVVSLRDETFDVRDEGGRYALTPRSLRVESETSIPVFQLGGFSGLGLPKYDRVNGLSLPVVGLVTLANGRFELEPSVTYRSRLGKLDPALDLRMGDTAGIQFIGRAARDTRTNDAWIYRDYINSLLSFTVGTDTRNYFRSDIAEGRVVTHLGSETSRLMPFIGGRYERVHPVSAVGNVFSLFGRHSQEHMARPNPLVQEGDIGSVLAGAEFTSRAGVVASAARAEVEQSVRAPGGSSFTQLTVHGTVEFPTVRDHRLRVRAHGVATRGDSVPMARFAYLGGSGTLPIVDLLELGGSELLFVESRYLIPVPGLVLPMVGSPIVTLRHLMGGAGVGSLGEFQQEVGVGVGLSVLRIDYTIGAGGRSGQELGVGISLGH